MPPIKPKRKSNMGIAAPIDLPRALAEVSEGETAYADGIAVDDCPYPSGTGAEGNKARAAWMTGWYDAKMRDKLGHIWAKYGMTYP